MNDIIEKQNKKEFIEYLKAQRVAYSQCKIFQIFDLVSILIAIILPIIGIIKKDFVNYLGAFGVLWTIIYLISENYRRKKTEQGAKLQEQFDTELYDIPWNNILCKNKISSDIRIDLAEKYKDGGLKNWYSKEVDKTLPKPIAILLCQRINFSWELKLRKLFVTFLVFTSVLYYGAFLGFFIYKNIGFYDILLLLVPSLSFLIYGIQNSLSLKSHIVAKRETLNQIDGFLNAYSSNRDLPNESILRQIQDVIYSERTFPEKIPDWFYKLNLASNENRTDAIIKSIKTKF
ncbi:S-4TM family putative pore-forming effector [Aquimarina sp. 2-A2]|uniref:S-4TM family putative pore-forming effector n=1 Tax=Aquimarina sp. 2-A2 TaxID=3382644 RepID=UPI00387F334B